MSRILVVEDDRAILKGLVLNLERESHEVVTATDGAVAYEIIGNEEIDLVVLDVMLPGMSGYELCRRLRQGGSTLPILMLTARGEEIDRVQGLDLGADDYVTKPFSLPELLARVRALLRRAHPPQALPDELRFNDVVVDFRSYQASKAGKPVRMTRKEYGTLRLLTSRAGEVVTRRDLLKEVWGYHRYPTTRTVDNHIASLRHKIEDDPAHPRHILTVHGVGYRFME